MYQLPASELKNILISELGYTPLEADQFLRTIPAVHENLQQLVERWLEDRTILDISVSGLTLSGIMDRRECNFIVALRYLNLLFDEDIPDERKKILLSMLNRKFEAE